MGSYGFFPVPEIHIILHLVYNNKRRICNPPQGATPGRARTQGCESEGSVVAYGSGPALSGAPWQLSEEQQEAVRRDLQERLPWPPHERGEEMQEGRGLGEATSHT